ncbi:MAG: S8/S53 family peptidase, partial [Burkholderiaceae bacterium]|nr:S8/S53 family peptidase [Burkholderiaceae bacterium]
MIIKLSRAAAAVALACSVGAASFSAHAGSAAKPLDLGATPPATQQTVSIVLKIQNISDLEQYVAGTVDPTSPLYQQFLSSRAFRQNFAPTNAVVKFIENAMAAQGITVNDVMSNNLVIHATGTTAQFNQLLQTQIHNYFDGLHYFHKPSTPGTIPTTLADLVLVIAGLNNQPQARPHSHRIPESTPAVGAVESVKVSLLSKGFSGGTTNGTPGQFTVADVANLYNINPLYKNHITGRGRTIGIATLANFSPADAYAYWNSVGLKVNQNRITQVHVDGGGGTAGSDETTLDVEQSGGIAPDAKMIVYDAPNTDAGFIDVFYQAIADNKVDTLSVSWGSPEIAQSTDTMIAQHQAFIVAAAQGISVFAAAGDEGAYDINNANGGYTYPTCTQTLTVDSPASDPYVTAAGGTTLPQVQQHKYGTVVVPAERPWGWDYLQNYMTTNYGSAFYYANYFPVGGGGGVSVNYDMPLYQQSTAGTQTTAGNQSLICAGTDYIDLQAGYAGRNVPDVSLNADPYTGYSVYYNGGWIYGFGGTSFVAPQLNGMTSLLSQAVGTRVGLMTPQLYARLNLYGYSKQSPFNAITTGDNLYWQAGPTYNPASGVGTLNLTNLVN